MVNAVYLFMLYVCVTAQKRGFLGKVCCVSCISARCSNDLCLYCRIKHENIVALEDIYESSDYLYLIMQL